KKKKNEQRQKKQNKNTAARNDVSTAQRAKDTRANENGETGSPSKKKKAYMGPSTRKRKIAMRTGRRKGKKNASEKGKEKEQEVGETEEDREEAERLAVASIDAIYKGLKAEDIRLPQPRGLRSTTVMYQYQLVRYPE